MENINERLEKMESVQNNFSSILNSKVNISTENGFSVTTKPVYSSQTARTYLLQELLTTRNLHIETFVIQKFDYFSVIGQYKSDTFNKEISRLCTTWRQYKFSLFKSISYLSETSQPLSLEEKKKMDG